VNSSYGTSLSSASSLSSYVVEVDVVVPSDILIGGFDA
jgi:hypothetical protein